MREETGKQFFIIESTDDSEVCVFGVGGAGVEPRVLHILL